MANTGPNYAASTAAPGMSNGWTSISSAVGSSHYGSGSGALDNSGKSDSGYLQFFYSISCPLTAHITGVLVELDLECVSDPVSGFVAHAQLLYLGSTIGSDKGLSGGLSFGADGDTWGLTLTPSVVNDPTFGFQFTGNAVSNGDNVYCGGCRVTVYYATPATPPNYACFQNLLK